MKYCVFLPFLFGLTSAFVNRPTFVSHLESLTKVRMVAESETLLSDLQNNKDKKTKVCVITGSSQGLGQAMAFELAKYGHNVVVNYFPGCQDAAQETVDKIKDLDGDGIALPADCTHPDEIKKMFDQIVDHYGKVDGTSSSSVLRQRTAGCPLSDSSHLTTTFLFYLPIYHLSSSRE
jgi:hypothetical protein